MPSNRPGRATGEPRRRFASRILRNVRRLVVGVVGLTVLAIGVAMIVLPGPATLVIPLGLGILALEFAWAERMLRRIKEEGRRRLGRTAVTPEAGDAPRSRPPRSA
jgi:uncharacterized protein (TIGR02611 family)